MQSVLILVGLLSCHPLSLVSVGFTAFSSVEELRLVGNEGADRGRVEVKVGGEWGTVCDDEWDHRDAKVVCRMLGQAGGVAFSGAYYGSGSGRILLDNVGCAGDEDHLNMCTLGILDPSSTSTCGHHEDAGARCGVDPPAYSDPRSASQSRRPSPVKPLPPNCKTHKNNPNVRLVGSGQDASSGLVQIRNPEGLSSEEFGFVCDDFWSVNNARVVCRELCFEPADAQPGWHKPASSRIPASPRIVLDNVRCTGAESSLMDCPHLPWNVHDCSASELASVTCTDVTQSPQVPQAAVDCQADGMVVTFLRAENPTLRMETIVTTHPTPSACKPVKSEDDAMIRLILPYARCARLTGDQKNSDGKLTFVSSLLVPHVRKSSPANGMSRVTEYRVDVTCNMAGSYSASRRLPRVGQPVLPASGVMQLNIDMNMYQDDTFTTPVVSEGVVLAPGGWVNLGVKLHARDTRVKLVVTTCYAGPELGNPAAPRQALLLNKCIQEDSVSLYPITDTFWGLRFQPFSFDTFSDVTIECEAYACNGDVASESCDRSCNAANNKHNKMPAKVYNQQQPQQQQTQQQQRLRRQSRSAHTNEVRTGYSPKSHLGEKRNLKAPPYLAQNIITKNKSATTDDSFESKAKNPETAKQKAAATKRLLGIIIKAVEATKSQLETTERQGKTTNGQTETVAREAETTKTIIMEAETTGRQTKTISKEPEATKGQTETIIRDAETTYGQTDTVSKEPETTKGQPETFSKEPKIVSKEPEIVTVSKELETTTGGQTETITMVAETTNDQTEAIAMVSETTEDQTEAITMVAETTEDQTEAITMIAETTEDQTEAITMVAETTKDQTETTSKKTKNSKKKTEDSFLPNADHERNQSGTRERKKSRQSKSNAMPLGRIVQVEGTAASNRNGTLSPNTRLVRLTVSRA